MVAGVEVTRRLFRSRVWCLYWESFNSWGWNKWNFLGVSVLDPFVGLPQGLSHVAASVYLNFLYSSSEIVGPDYSRIATQELVLEVTLS